MNLTKEEIEMLESLLNCLLAESGETLNAIGVHNIVAKIYTKKVELADSILNKLQEEKK